MTTRDILVALSTITVVSFMGAAAPQTSPPQVTTGPPVVLNGSLNATTVSTLIPGTGSGYIVYSLTNEDPAAGIRCTFGGIAGQIPVVPPTPTSGTLIAAGVTFVERTAPSNRLDCIATVGNPRYDLTLYPK